MDPGVKYGMLALLAALAGGYFAVVAWNANRLAQVLLRRGWAERGWSEGRLTLSLRGIGVAGVALSLVAIGLAVSRVFS